MADQLPFDSPPDAQQRTQPGFGDIANQWNSFLSQPGAGAFMLNAGIALMQPPSFGDTPTSQIGRAIGAGAEAAGRGEFQESKVGEMEARSMAAQARAETAGTALSLKELALQQQGLRQQQGLAANLRKTYQAYTKQTMDQYNKDIKAWNEAKSAHELTSKQPFSVAQPERPQVLGFEDWANSQGLGNILQGGTGVQGQPGSPRRPANTYTPGTVYPLRTRSGGTANYVYNGGDPADIKSWTKVGSQAPTPEGE